MSPVMNRLAEQLIKNFQPADCANNSPLLKKMDIDTVAIFLKFAS